MFDESINEMNTLQATLDSYIGRNKEELQKLLGKPTKIISPSIEDRVQYDEEWQYITGIPMINQQFRIFYINKSKVVRTRLAGIF